MDLIPKVVLVPPALTRQFRDPSEAVGSALVTFESCLPSIHVSMSKFLIQAASGYPVDLELSPETEDALEDATMTGGHLSPQTARTVLRAAVQATSAELAPIFNNFTITATSGVMQDELVVFGGAKLRTNFFTPLEDKAAWRRTWFSRNSVQHIVRVRDRINSFSSDIRRSASRLASGGRSVWSEACTIEADLVEALREVPSISGQLAKELSNNATRQCRTIIGRWADLQFEPSTIEMRAVCTLRHEVLFPISRRLLPCAA